MFHVYILTDPLRKALYVNSTDDLCDTIANHKRGLASAFTRKYKLFDMVYLESFSDGETALTRQRQLRSWRRDWKWSLITAANPKLKELTCVDPGPKHALRHKKSSSREKLLCG